MENNINVTPEVTPAERKPYATPTLADLGSFAEITQGAVNTGVDAVVYS
jgi:hypothetical protein